MAASTSAALALGLIHEYIAPWQRPRGACLRAQACCPEQLRLWLAQGWQGGGPAEAGCASWALERCPGSCGTLPGSEAQPPLQAVWCQQAPRGWWCGLCCLAAGLASHLLLGTCLPVCVSRSRVACSHSRAGPDLPVPSATQLAQSCMQRGHATLRVCSRPIKAPSAVPQPCSTPGAWR